jgi:hypothetical protein
VKKRKRSRGRAKRCQNRRQMRKDMYEYHTLWKHEEMIAVERAERQKRPPTRQSPAMFPFRPTHYREFQGTKLKFVGYDLTVGYEKGKGLGLVSRVSLEKSSPITQYEGRAYTKAFARSLSEGQGLDMGSHFATPGARMFLINGFAVYPCPLPDPTPGKCKGTPIAQHELKGYGGGSFCNHSDHPNAKLVRSDKDDGLGLFVVAIRDIKPGEFITIDYSNMFINSKWTNISK